VLRFIIEREQRGAITEFIPMIHALNIPPKCISFFSAFVL
jgi:hypothetical protein